MKLVNSIAGKLAFPLLLAPSYCTQCTGLFASNHIDETTVCWTEGWPAWSAVGDAPGFVETLMQAPSASVGPSFIFFAAELQTRGLIFVFLQEGSLTKPSARLQAASDHSRKHLAAAREAAVAISAGQTGAVASKPVAATATFAAAPAKAAAEDDPDEELRRFQAEMAQLEADPAGDDEDRPATPECAPSRGEEALS